MPSDALRALVRWELDRLLTRRSLVMALLVFIGVRAAGMATDSGLFGEAFFFSLIGVVHYGLATDRRCRLDAYLIWNHVRPNQYLAAKVLAMIAMIGAYGAFAAVVETVFSGDVGMALWRAGAATFGALMAAPIAMMIEAHADTSMPAALVILPYAIGGFLVFATTGSLLVFEVTGFAALEPGVWSSMSATAWRTAVVLPVGFACAAGVTRLSLPRY